MLFRSLLTQDSLLPLAKSAADSLTAKNHRVSIEDLLPLHHVFPTLARAHENGFHDPGRYPEPPKPWTPDDVAWILHSSGSTGLPKPVPQTQKMVMKWCKDSMYGSRVSNCLLTPVQVSCPIPRSIVSDGRACTSRPSTPWVSWFSSWDRLWA